MTPLVVIVVTTCIVVVEEVEVTEAVFDVVTVSVTVIFLTGCEVRVVYFVTVEVFPQNK